MDLTCCSVTFFQRTMEYLRLQNETTISRQMCTGVAYGRRCTRCWKEAAGPKHSQLDPGLLCKERS